MVTGQIAVLGQLLTRSHIATLSCQTVEVSSDAALHSLPVNLQLLLLR